MFPLELPPHPFSASVAAAAQAARPGHRLLYLMSPLLWCGLPGTPGALRLLYGALSRTEEERADVGDGPELVSRPGVANRPVNQDGDVTGDGSRQGHPLFDEQDSPPQPGEADHELLQDHVGDP